MARAAPSGTRGVACGGEPRIPGAVAPEECQLQWLLAPRRHHRRPLEQPRDDGGPWRQPQAGGYGALMSLHLALCDFLMLFEGRLVPGLIDENAPQSRYRVPHIYVTQIERRE